MNEPRCGNCHKPLTDPVSIALGRGPECRGKQTKAQIRRDHRLARGRQFATHQPMAFPDQTYHWQEGQGWTDEAGTKFTSDEEMRKWLNRYNLIETETETEAKDRILLSFFVPGPPRAKQSFKYAGKASYTPARVKGWQADVGWAAQQALRAKSMTELYESPTDALVEVTLVFQLADRRRIDLDNLSKAVLDGLNKVVWADDRQVMALHIYKVLQSDTPGVHVEIKTLQEEQKP